MELNKSFHSFVNALNKEDSGELQITLGFIWKGKKKKKKKQFPKTNFLFFFSFFCFRIQFIGACNPPTDPGRVPLTHRFLRHAPLLLVDFPAVDSLTQIYGTFCRALLKLVPNLRAYAQPLTDAMVEFYSKSQKKFTPDMQQHYIYSPRELSRWIRALHEAVKSKEVRKFKIRKKKKINIKFISHFK